MFAEQLIWTKLSLKDIISIALIDLKQISNKYAYTITDSSKSSNRKYTDVMPLFQFKQPYKMYSVADPSV